MIAFLFQRRTEARATRILDFFGGLRERRQGAEISRFAGWAADRGLRRIKENEIAALVVDAAYRLPTGLGPGSFGIVAEVSLAHDLAKLGESASTSRPRGEGNFPTRPMGLGTLGVARNAPCVSLLERTGPVRRHSRSW